MQHTSLKRKRDEKEEQEARLQYNIAQIEKIFCKKMDCRANQLVAQQIQETVHNI